MICASLLLVRHPRLLLVRIDLYPLAFDSERDLRLCLALTLLYCSPVPSLRFYQDALCLSKVQPIAFSVIREEICLSEMGSIVLPADSSGLIFCLAEYFHCFACAYNLFLDCCYAFLKVNYSADGGLLSSY